PPPPPPLLAFPTRRSSELIRFIVRLRSLREKVLSHERKFLCYNANELADDQTSFCLFKKLSGNFVIVFDHDGFFNWDRSCHTCHDGSDFESSASSYDG